MKYEIFNEPDYYLEGIYALMEIYGGGETLPERKKRILEEHAGEIAEEDLNPLFDGPSELIEHIRLNIRFEAPDFPEAETEIGGFLFREREEAHNPLAVVFYFYSRLFRFEPAGVENAIAVFADEDAFLEDAAGVPKTSAEMFNWINSRKLSASMKYDLLQVYFNFEAYRACAEKVIAETSALIKERINLFSNKIELCMEYVRQGLAGEGSAFFRENCNVLINDNFDYEIRPYIYGLNSIAFMGIHQKMSILVGIGFFEMKGKILDAQTERDLLAEFLKTLSDGTKLSILQMLKTETCFGAQLAEKLGLTGATVSHHMSALLRLKLVFAEKENNRVYYSINLKQIGEYLDVLKAYLM